MKKFIITILLMIIVFNTFAQVLYTPIQKTLKKLVEQNLILIKQEYALKSPVSGIIYGRNNNDFYGVVNFIGIKTTNKLWIPDFVQRPWMFDQSYVTIDSLRPILWRTYFRNWNNPNFTRIYRDSFIINTLQQRKIIAIKKQICGVDYIPNYIPHSDLWIVLLKGDVEHITYNIYKTNNYSIDSNNYYIKINLNNNKIIGGFAFKDTIINCNLYIKLIGIFTKKQNDWVIATLPAENEINPNISRVVYTKIIFKNKQGKTINNLCNIKVIDMVNNDEIDLCTNDNGSIEFVFKNNHKYLIYVNDVPAFCLKQYIKKYTVILKKKHNSFFPLKKYNIRKCH